VLHTHMSRKVLLITLLVLLITGQAHPVMADGHTWSSIGPEGGTTYALAIDPAAPATLYAGTDGGVFKSTNGGASWRAASTGLTYITVRSLALDPATPTTVYAGTNGGMFKSTNGGESMN
jgi:hypothetical protein